MTPAADLRYRTWRAGCIEGFREVNLNTEDLFDILPFRRAALILSKRLGLTRTCAVLESNLYFRKH